MAIESVAIALHHSKAKGTVKLVLIGIANHDGDAGSFPKTATLAKYANVHPRRVSAAIAELVKLGEIRVIPKKGGGHSLRDELRPNVYEIMLECPANCDRTKGHNLLDDHGQRLHFGRSYSGPYTPDREKDPVAVERGKRGRAKRLGEPVDNVPQDQGQAPQEPGDGNSTSDADSTRSSDADSTRASDADSTTRNHPTKHPENPALVPTSPADGAAVDNSKLKAADAGTLRELVPALPRAKPGRNDATPKPTAIKDHPGLMEQKQSRHAAGAALARAALRGTPVEKQL